MDIRFEFKNRELARFTDIYDKYSPSEFDSPFRSTVPFLQYWRNTQDSLLRFLEAMQLGISGRVTLGFEHCVFPPRGEGRPSQTDLMMVTEGLAIAVEAKYTEGRYATVEKWIGSSDNRRLVLGGWLELIASACKRRPLQVKNVLHLPYQLVHRYASVCSISAARRAVVYECFDLNESKMNYYTGQLRALRDCMGTSTDLYLAVVNHTMVKKDAYEKLQSLWRDGKRSMHGEVIDLLRRDSVATFQKPEVRVV